MTLGFKTLCPADAPREIREAWDSFTEGRKVLEAKKLGTARIRRLKESTGYPVVNSPAAETLPPASSIKPADKVDIPPSGPMRVQDWNEDLVVDGKVIPAQRIRYAIIELLDYQKNPWYVANMSFGLVRRQTKRLLEDATPGWFPDPDPLTRTTVVTVDEGKVPVIKIREPKNESERQRLRAILTKPNGGINSYVAERLARKDCPKCCGESTYRVQTFPNDKRLSWQTHTVYCECIFS